MKVTNYWIASFILAFAPVFFDNISSRFAVIETGDLVHFIRTIKQILEVE